MARKSDLVTAPLLRPSSVTAGPRNRADHISLNLSNINKDDVPPSELQQRREKFAYFEKRCSKVAQSVFLGSDAVARNRATLKTEGITHVVNCAAHICLNYFEDELTYYTMWLQDTPAEEITSLLYSAIDFIDAAIESGGRVFIHCSQGVSRSSTFAIAYLMYREGASYDATYQAVKAVHGIANPNMGFACQLLQWHKRRMSGSPAEPSRLYRLAPHSDKSARKIVPKHASSTNLEALDSRGAFVLHTPTALFIWRGTTSTAELLEAAVVAARQLVMYEGSVEPQLENEGQESDAFLEAIGATARFTSPMFNASYDKEYEIHTTSLAPDYVPPAPGMALAQLRGSGGGITRQQPNGRFVTEPAPKPAPAPLAAVPRVTDVMPSPRGPAPTRIFENTPRVADPMATPRGHPSDAESMKLAAPSVAAAAAPPPVVSQVELYEYPDLEKLTLFDCDDLLSSDVFALVVRPKKGQPIIFIWIGNDYNMDTGKTAVEQGEQIAQEVADGLSIEVQAKNVKVEVDGAESSEFWGWFEDG
ncbi:hypothetical protein CYMTET_23391 [Cymbomonas tetramitiformis]|uniref:Uncharacterized protein n=1 Tax=Cymbomonas tetramitiformis TaxID=36881 RepID=A0AAE0FZF5_9CHLO|nr:hypothetical protein CYMTET_23391 [Cymbomonas tetramitiformis]|eukprot:gene13516-15979_t